MTNAQHFFSNQVTESTGKKGQKMNTNSIEIISVYVNLRKVSKQLRKKIRNNNNQVILVLMVQIHCINWY